MESNVLQTNNNNNENDNNINNKNTTSSRNTLLESSNWFTLVISFLQNPVKHYGFKWTQKKRLCVFRLKSFYYPKLPHIYCIGTIV